jgi:hypothetical protein
MATFWILIEVEQGGRCFAYVERVTSADNIFPLLQRAQGVTGASVYANRKIALEEAEQLNALYQAQGVYMYEGVIKCR